MNDFITWLTNLPMYFAEMFSWLTQEISIGSFTFTPLMAFGAGAGLFVGVVLVLKIKNLII